MWILRVTSVYQFKYTRMWVSLTLSRSLIADGRGAHWAGRPRERHNVWIQCNPTHRNVQSYAPSPAMPCHAQYNWCLCPVAHYVFRVPSSTCTKSFAEKLLALHTHTHTHSRITLLRPAFIQTNGGWKKWIEKGFLPICRRIRLSSIRAVSVRGTFSCIFCRCVRVCDDRRIWISIGRHKLMSISQHFSSIFSHCSPLHSESHRMCTRTSAAIVGDRFPNGENSISFNYYHHHCQFRPYSLTYFLCIMPDTQYSQVHRIVGTLKRRRFVSFALVAATKSNSISNERIRESKLLARNMLTNSSSAFSLRLLFLCLLLLNFNFEISKMNAEPATTTTRNVLLIVRASLTMWSRVWGE